MTILILQPIAPDTTPALRARADALLAQLEGNNPGMRFDIQQDDTRLDIPPHPSLYMKHATVRNYMLDRYLRDEHTYVLWIDSDLVDYPADLPMQLYRAAEQQSLPCGCGAPAILRMAEDVSRCAMCRSVFAPSHTIAAPLPILSPTSGWPGRFYDIGGFIENGNRARMFPPWFDQRGEVIELDSVGCCYLAPAELYRDSTPVHDGGLRLLCAQHLQGARYKPPSSDYYVEHWSVMQEARRQGYRIVALTTTIITHAWLPDYGMEAH